MAYCMIPGILRSTIARINALAGHSPAIFPSAILEDMSNLVWLSKVIGDAEERSSRDSRVEHWLSELKVVAYYAEDVIDEFVYENLRYKSGDEVQFSDDSDEPNPRNKSGDEGELSDDIGGSRPMKPRDLSELDLVIPDEPMRRLKELLARFDEIRKISHGLKLLEDYRVIKRGGYARIEPETSRLKTVCNFGREKEMEKITEFLLSTECGTGVVSVLAIVGQAGVGKTALAQLISNDPMKSYNFDLRAWVNLSEGFCVTTITRTILQSFRKKTYTTNDETRLQKELVRELTGKRFFIVLDDIHHENESLWERFLAPFLYAQSGKIIITTRSTSTAEIMQTLPQVNLELLNFETCCSIFQKSTAVANRRHFETGRKIVAKCGGVPLFVKAVACALKLENDKQKWLKFERQYSSSSCGANFSPLKLCYECMPIMLKQCFLFLAMYPCGHVFFKEDLVRLWKSVGLLEEEEEELIDVGSSIFYELVQRAVFEPAYGVYGRNDGFLVHQLVHDLARSVACKELAVVKHDCLHDISKDVRYLSIVVPSLAENVDLQPLKECRHLRVLQILNQGNTQKGGGVKIEIPNELFEQFKYLRSLIIRDINLETLPDSIGNLKLLRSLDLTNTRIHELPGSIRHLYGLKELELTNCPLRELPAGIKNLINLQILNFQKSFCLGIPRGIGKLFNLKTLPRFDVRRDNWHSELFELNGLVNLRGELIIAGLGNLTNEHEIKEINLQNKIRLQALTLDWSSESSRSSDEGCTSAGVDSNFDEQVIERFQPHTNLKELHIHNYGGSKFPSWLSNSSFTSLGKLSLIHCNECDVLPTLGQLLYLKNLSIRSFSNLRFLRREFCSSSDAVEGFRSLEKLEFVDMVKWSEWTGVNEGEFRSLRNLKLVDCPMLTLIPKLLCSSMVKLVIKDCGMLTSLPSASSVRNLSLTGNISKEMFHCFDLPFLTTLKFSLLRNVRSISLNHAKLLRLHRLEIHGCRKLESVGGINGLSSLNIFNISACQNLQFSLNEELPEALIRLGISGCPKLISWKRSHEIKYYDQLHMHEEDYMGENPADTWSGDSDGEILD